MNLSQAKIERVKIDNTHLQHQSCSSVLDSSNKSNNNINNSNNNSKSNVGKQYTNNSKLAHKSSYDKVCEFGADTQASSPRKYASSTDFGSLDGRSVECSKSTSGTSYSSGYGIGK